MPVDFDRDLNPEQRAAALAPDGPVLVIAAAGTGKTRTLTYRVAHLVERGVPPERILLLTFTNRAAREMLDRARRLVGEAVGGVWGGTFHHFAHRLLRRHGARIGLDPAFVILDDDDAQSVLRRATAEARRAHPHFPKVEVLHDAISLARNRGEDPLVAVPERFAELPVPPEVIVAAVRDYAAAKRAVRGVDFDDLLEFALVLFQQAPDVLERYREQFQHVLVDEYQDTNPIQARLVDEVAARHRNLLVVGDDFQSIYSWRGADYRHFLSFPQRYPDAFVVRLETNYRSVPGILAVANACIAGNPDQFQKTLRPVRGEDLAPYRADLRDGAQQARFVRETAEELHAAGYAWRDIAVLYRSHYHALELQLELQRARVPFRIVSGVRFFEQAHIKDVLAPLRLAVDPTDALAFVRLLPLLPRVGEATARALWRRLGGRWSPMVEEDRRRLAAALPEAAAADWAAWAEAFAGADPAQPAELIHRFTEAFYARHLRETFEDPERRREDIEELERFIARFRSAAEFLEEVALLTNVDTAAPADEPDAEDRLLLTTVHQAKGLEWPVVFVVWLAEGMFPSGRAVADDGREGLAEERRLFYVAVTRARDHLFLCVPRMRLARDQSPQFYSPSRFLQELPPGLLQRVSLRAF
ncbi:MAG: ATP-dependent helicase [Kiritimatiellae bacterium]|nr:ATP-dependent helicase [Kiritimatiellia bacterium]